MRFRYVGEEYTEWFGFKWMTGTEHDVTDEHAVSKLKNSVLFQAVEAAPPNAPEAAAQRRGRPRKIVEVEADGDDAHES